MGRKNTKKRCSKAQIEAKLAENKQAKLFALQKHITIFILLFLLIVGLVSTTFASFVPQDNSQSGSLVADIQTLAVNQGHKVDLADTRANVDIAQTGADRTFVAGERFYLKNFAVSGWNNTNWIVSNGTAWVHFWNSSNSSVGTLDLEFKLLSGTHGAVDAIYYVEIPPEHAGKTYNYFIITRNQAGNSIWSNWNQTGDMQMPSHRSNRVYGMTAGGTSRSYDWYAETPTALTASVTNAVSGTGTSADPYIVRPGASYTVQLKATKPNPGNEGFGYNINSSSTSTRTASTSGTYTKSYTASTTEQTLTYTGYAWAYDEHGTDGTLYYSDSYKSSNTIYVKIMAAPFEVGDTIYFDCSGSTTWGNNTIYVQLNNNTTNTGTRAQMTKIGTYLYKYTFTAATATSGNVRIWSGTSYYTVALPKSTYTSYNGVYVTSTTSNTGTRQKFAIGTVNTPTITVSDNDIVLGESTTLTSSSPVLNYTRAGTSYTTTAVGATYVFKQGTTSLASSSSTSYSWKPTTCGTYSVTVQITSTAAGKSSSASSAKTVTVRPADPGAVTITGSNHISGAGTSANPYIVFSDAAFKLTGTIPTPTTTGAVGYFATSATGTYSSTNSFAPSLTTKGTAQTYSIYAKTYANSVYSTNYTSATAYYIVFNHLNGANTGFTVSDTTINDTQSITFSNPYVNGVEAAEKAYITQTYQVSSDNSNFSDLSSDTWTPDAVGNYYFRVKTTNTKTGETVYSSSQMVTVIQSTVYYNISVVGASGTSACKVTLKTNGTTITDNKILSNDPLTISVVRSNSTPANRYFSYIKVTDGTNSWNVNNLNGDLKDTLVIDHVKGNVTIEYKSVVKPYVQPQVPSNASSISFKYFVDGVEKTATTAGTYYVDYNSNISYSVTPKTGYYVQSMTGVTMGANTSSTVTGTKNNVIANVGAVTATLTANKTVTVNIDKTSTSTDGASMTIDGSAVAFGTATPLNYGAQSTVVITPPQGYYAVVSGESVQSTISTDGKATFNVTLTGENKTYTVKFVENPKIYMVQPEYGSVYVTDDLGNYYFNGDSVGYGTKLTVNVKPDHTNAKLIDVLVNDASIGTVDGSTFAIKVDSTATADITVDQKFAFDTITAYSYRRIFYTDNAGWGDGQVVVHYSNKTGDVDFTKNTVAMTYKYTNDMNQRVYTADIPFSAKYVNFCKKSDTTKYTASASIDNDNNAFYIDEKSAVPYPISDWNMNYSDYIASDRADTIQQALTSKGQAATFTYSCDYGDGTLSAEAVAGNAITYDFNKGTLSITPTESKFNYSLVKVTSSASTTVKYYLIKVENFEIVSFSGLQKIYNTNVFNNIQLDLILSGGVLDYAAKYMVSDSNYSGTFKEIEDGKNSGFTPIDSVQGHINSFLIEYAINSVSGVKYYKVEASDNANHKATKTMKTLFGANTHIGDRCLYFYNDTNVDLSKYNLRVCFFDANDSYKFATMQRVGSTDYYRATIPTGYESKVNFYLCNPKTFSNNFADYDGTDDSTETYSFGVFDATIPTADNANIVYAVSSINTDDGMIGQFVEFDY